MMQTDSVAGQLTVGNPATRLNLGQNVAQMTLVSDNSDDQEDELRFLDGAVQWRLFRRRLGLSVWMI